MPVTIEKKPFRSFDLTPEIIDRGRALGIWGDTEARLKRMIRRAAVFTHEEGNRRFDKYLFRVNGSQVEAVFQLDPQTRQVIA